MAFASLAIHSTVDFGLQIPANAVLAGVLCATCARSARLQRDRHRGRPQAQKRRAEPPPLAGCWG